MSDWKTRHRGILSWDRRALFVPVLQGMWIKTDPCVAEGPCHTCGAEQYEPCRGNGGLPVAFVHHKRKGEG